MADPSGVHINVKESLFWSEERERKVNKPVPISTSCYFRGLGKYPGLSCAVCLISTLGLKLLDYMAVIARSLVQWGACTGSENTGMLCVREYIVHMFIIFHLSLISHSYGLKKMLITFLNNVYGREFY